MVGLFGDFDIMELDVLLVIILVLFLFILYFKKMVMKF